MGATAQTFGYRLDGAVASIGRDHAGSRRLDLDTSGRVTGVHAVDWTDSYVYDASGNVASSSCPGVSAGGWTPSDDHAESREYSGTLIHRSGGFSYQHDGQGRMVVRSRKRISREPETWHFAYDSSDRLVDATSAERRWSYTYDAFGRRISKQRVDRDGLVVERVDFSWDGDRLIEQSRDTGIRPVETTTWEYLPGSWTPIAQTVNRAGGDPADVEFYAVVSDMIGKPTELMTPDGARVAWRDGESTLWGAPRRDAKSSSNSSNRYDAACPLRFPGQYADDETGLHYNRHRYYDPESARYTTGDPLGLAPAPDPHAYVPNPTTGPTPSASPPATRRLFQTSHSRTGSFIDRHQAHPTA